MKKTNQRLFYPQKVKRQLFCALVACAVCAIPVNAQSGTISLNKSNVSMHTIMQEVEGQSDYTFFYNDNQIKLDKKVSVKAQNATIEQVLAQMFKNSGYTYKIVNNQIIVSKANAVAAVEKQQQQQAKKVTGCVKDALGEPIIGASVVEKGAPTNGTITDFDGNFTIKAAEKSILKVSYIGYAAQIIPVSKKDFYPVVMKQDTEVLDEVVVTALGIKLSLIHI